MHYAVYANYSILAFLKREISSDKGQSSAKKTSSLWNCLTAF